MLHLASGGEQIHENYSEKDAACRCIHSAGGLGTGDHYSDVLDACRFGAGHHDVCLFQAADDSGAAVAVAV